MGEILMWNLILNFVEFEISIFRFLEFLFSVFFVIPYSEITEFI
ncbi:hypothetical protein DF16_pBMB7921orf00001 (plasmid) [Bacillus thuringiensis serovar kurstaki str. YBT-1520]|nr:hypothetical protein DF16_pBMB7921orf00001 [Bacillus thuringiensis serovar kurstaki str. YBT-1520]